MTGYGKAETNIPGGKITVEIKSLNGKNADISIKTTLLPKDKELNVRQFIAQKLYRGNIDFFMTFEPNAAEDAKEIDTETALAYYRQIHNINSLIDNEFPGEGNIDARHILSTILRFPDVMDSGKKQDIVNDENWEEVFGCISRAVDNLCAYREAEGKSLLADVSAKVANIVNFIPEIEALEGERITAVKEKINSKLSELAVAPNPERLEQEMIFYIEKLDINEEKLRLANHLDYFIDTLDNGHGQGKKLGFISQEMGREINTLGSKSNHAEMQILVVKMKDELEQIKEQVLNVM